MSPLPLPSLPVGHFLGQGRYKIVRKLGEGGYGSVYLAEDTRLAGRRVAVKELHDPSPAAQQLFKHEAVLLASLNHPGLVSVSDFFDEDTGYFLVMDYVEGQDLLEMVIEAEKARRMLPSDQVAEWMLQVCQAVAYLHHQKPPVIHRDIKPNNIRLNKSERAILVDFGIAKVDPKAKTHMIAKAISAGFSPPEQYAGGGGTDTRSDVYALGATLYCMLTVNLPPDSFARLTQDTPLTPPRQINPATSPALEAVVLKAMALNSLHRFQDAGEMLAALEAALGHRAGAPSGWGVRPPAQPACPHCGCEHRPAARFCPQCGAGLDSVQHCAVCGAACRPEARFCPHCRALLEA